MAIIVNTNMSALKTQANLNSATNTLNTSLNRMSTGLKINSAADDAAGMFVASNLNTQIRGSKIAQSNVATGINVLQTAEGDFGVIEDNLLRIRDLATQAANGVYDQKSLTAMEDEVKARVDEINRIAKSSNFNGLNLLDGSIAKTDPSGLRLQVGANSATETNAIYVAPEVFDSASAQALGLYGANSVNNFTSIEEAFEFASTAAKFIADVDVALQNVTTRKATIGAVQNRLNSAADSLVTTIENATSAKSTIMDADIAEESANYTKAQILQQTSATLLVQANQPAAFTGIEPDWIIKTTIDILNIVDKVLDKFTIIGDGNLPEGNFGLFFVLFYLYTLAFLYKINIMFIKSLILKNYRNYSNLKLDFHSKKILFIGKNAQGKTNLLESVYYLSCLGSPRAKNDTDFIKWGENTAFVSAILEKPDFETELSVKINPPQKKELKVNQVKKSKSSEFCSHLSVVSFSVNDLLLLRGVPEDRRSWLDLAISQIYPAYPDRISKYNKIRTQKNNYLKEIKGNISANTELLDVWNSQLCVAGSNIIYLRLKFLNELQKIAIEKHFQIAADEYFSILYNSTVSGDINFAAEQNITIENIVQDFQKKLEERKTEEIIRAQALVGPHRDDVSYFINNII